MKVTALDFFLHQSLGFRIELHCHTFNLALSGTRRKLGLSAVKICCQSSIFQVSSFGAYAVISLCLGLLVDNIQGLRKSARNPSCSK